MEYTSKLLIKFLNKLIAFDKNSNAVIKISAQKVNEREMAETSEWEIVKTHTEENAKKFITANESLCFECQKSMADVLDRNITNKKGVFTRIQKCKELLSLIFYTEKSINDQKSYSTYANKRQECIEISIEELIRGNIDFILLASEINYLLRKGKRKELSSKCPYFYALCRYSENILNQELDSLRELVSDNQDSLYQKYLVIGEEIHSRAISQWDSAMETFAEKAAEFVEQKQNSEEETRKELIYNEDSKGIHLQKFIDRFFAEFPPKEMADEYTRLYSMEPSYEHYESYKEMPRNIYISNLEYNISNLELSDYTKSFLDRYYFFLYRNNKISIPYCASFGSEFNYLFRFNGEGRSNVVKNACDLGMRLFMMLPPGKLNFTFIDPVTLGESFAMFTRLVDVDNRTSEVINGKIWSSPADIEQKLKVMTDHISNVTQRCLQGKYDNIYEYNCFAEQNAEAYQVLMLMDFPAGLTDQSLKLLEQIVTSGPKCGVFTVIYRNESQYKKISERFYPLITNIETNFQMFNFNDNCTQISCFSEKIKDKELLWNSLQLPNKNQMDKIITTLKKEIKNAEKVVIGIEKVSNAETTASTKDGIRIPIGIHGANEVQYLTLGVGGSHHALIAGVAGSGKSSLLHTIILRTLTQYSPDELSIYLVDFKRGVEFKIYADFVLPSFKVVAIESEREFGYNILMALEREQKIRADLFKKNHVDKIEEYRQETKKKMPRILVIMDEFHELFSNANDEFSKKSAVIMERIVRQGRAFGVHLILASQSYSNITGVDCAVFDQMAVRIVLKCSKADANLLLDNGSSEIDQISIDDPGRAVYNSEAGNKEYNSHFRVAYIDPTKHRGMLEDISDKTKEFADSKQPTRILLSNIEDNNLTITVRLWELIMQGIY